MTNLEEFSYGSDVNLVKTSGDSLNDSAEVTVGRNPTVDVRVVITLVNGILLLRIIMHVSINLKIAIIQWVGCQFTHV